MTNRSGVSSKYASISSTARCARAGVIPSVELRCWTKARCESRRDSGNGSAFDIALFMADNLAEGQAVLTILARVRAGLEEFCDESVG